MGGQTTRQCGVAIYIYIYILLNSTADLHHQCVLYSSRLTKKTQLSHLYDMVKFSSFEEVLCVIILYGGYIPTDAFCHCSRHCDVTTRPMVSIVVHSRGDLLLWATVMACLYPRDTGRRTFGSKFRQNVAKNVAKSGMKSLPLRLVGFTACVTVTPLTHVTCYGWDSNRLPKSFQPVRELYAF